MWKERKMFGKYFVLVVVVVLVVQVGVAISAEVEQGSDCFVKWVHGYRLASGRPQKILHSVSLEICKQECSSTPGCAAFAYGPVPQTQPDQQHQPNSNYYNASSSICELAINSRLRSQSSQSLSSSSSSSPSSRPPQQQRSYHRFFRDGRAVLDNNNGSSTTTTSSPSSSGAPTITISDLDRNPTYDVYIENPNANEPCYKREPLYDRDYNSGNQLGSGAFSHHGQHQHHFQGSSSGGVPIDCFYRLMSGKRLVKTHTLRAISVNSLQECQEACIHERGFSCRSISYRYMPSSGYSYPVSNCELSSYYMQSGAISSSYSKLDFVEDYDYDYFQRETHCKTTSSTTLGVCAVVVRRGGRVSTTLIKSSHHTVTSSQCEHLCATSLFRCRAFAFRHTTRGRDPYVSRYPESSHLSPTRDLPPPQDHTCLLYDTDLMRLPSYNIEPDPDFDLFEMGRLMGAECVLYEQFLNRRPGYYNPGPVTSTASYPENREYYGGHHGGGGSNYYGGGSNYNHGNSNERVDQHPHGTGMNYLINRDHHNGNNNNHHLHGGVMGQGGNSNNNNNNSPPSTLETGLMIGGHHAAGGGGRPVDRLNERPPPMNMQLDNTVNSNNRGHGSTVQAQHTQGPVLMEFNNSSSGSSNNDYGGTRDHNHREHQSPPYYDKGKESCLRVYRQDSYLIPEVARATFPVKSLDECRIECIRSVEVLRFPCRAMAYRHTSHSSIDRTAGGTCQLSDTDPREPDLVQSRDRYEGAVTFLYEDREVGCGRGAYNGAGGGSYYEDNRGRDRHAGYVDYYNQNRNTYYPSYHHQNHHGSSYYDRNRDRDYYDNRASSRYDYDRRWSSQSAPPNYNAHYWDYHNRYGGSSVGGGGNRYQPEASNYYSDYRGGQGGTTVNGERCLRGCRQNRDAGFYYCQIDEQGAWDFCCRPDHFCGYSKGLSVPWCYVGTGPSQNIWRSCETKGSRNNPFYSQQPTVAYLHDRLPPTVHKLTSTQVANLTKDNAIRLFTNNTIEEIGGPGSSNSVDSKDINGLVAKGVSGSQEVIVRVSNSSSSNSSVDNNKSSSGKKSS